MGPVLQEHYNYVLYRLNLSIPHLYPLCSVDFHCCRNCAVGSFPKIRYFFMTRKVGKNERDFEPYFCGGKEKFGGEQTENKILQDF